MLHADATIRERRGRRVVTALAALAALTSAACTGGESAPERVPAAGARPGGHLVVGITAPGAVEPSTAYDSAGTLIASTLCEPLVHLDAVTGDPLPGLAEAWTISDDGKRFTVKLRKNVRLHDGNKLTADDVVFSLSRLASLDNASYMARLLEPIEGYAEVHGDRETDNPQHREQLKGLRVIEGGSFEIKLRYRYADFMRVLAHVAVSPVPKRLVNRDPTAFERQPVCAGPYRLRSPWTPESTEVVLDRFDRFYGKAKGYTRGGAGYADTITFRVFPDMAAAMAAYRAGTVDIVPLAPADLPAARAFGAEAVTAPNGGIEYIGVPNGVKPFDEARVRQAMSIALDRNQAIAAGLGGAGVPATGFVPPNVGTFFEPDKCGAATPGMPDVERARALVAESGISLNGVKLKLYYNDEFGNDALVRNVAQQWRSAFGLELELTPLIWDKYLAQAHGTTGFDGLFRESWRPLAIGPEGYLHPLFHSAGIGVDNFARFRSPAVDRAFDRGARQATSDEARVYDYRRIERMVCEAMPMVPVAFAVGGSLVRHGRVGSASEGLLHPATGAPALRELFVRP